MTVADHDITKKTVLVTGGSAGLGAAIANRLAIDGWNVFAGSRRTMLGDDAHPSIKPVSLDVTRADDHEDMVRFVVAEAGTLDAIICNAGINVSAPAEELAPERARAIMDTNFWGVVHGVRAALPHFREQRKGIVLVVGSLAGMVSPPGEAYYAASKHALRGFLESLQYEVSGLGVAVRLVEPGFIKTDLASASAPNKGEIADYDRLRARLEAHWQSAIHGGMSPDEAATRIAQVLTNANSPFRTRIGRDAIWVPRWKALLPEKLFFAIARRRFGLDEV